jgi:hypothetical protein
VQAALCVFLSLSLLFCCFSLFLLFFFVSFFCFFFFYLLYLFVHSLVSSISSGGRGRLPAALRSLPVARLLYCQIFFLRRFFLVYFVCFVCFLLFVFAIFSSCSLLLYGLLFFGDIWLSPWRLQRTVSCSP